jgi:hypothetical protein
VIQTRYPGCDSTGGGSINDFESQRFRAGTMSRRNSRGELDPTPRGGMKPAGSLCIRGRLLQPCKPNGEDAPVEAAHCTRHKTDPMRKSCRGVRLFQPLHLTWNSNGILKDNIPCLPLRRCDW